MNNDMREFTAAIVSIWLTNGNEPVLATNVCGILEDWDSIGAMELAEQAIETGYFDASGDYGHRFLTPNELALYVVLGPR